MTDYKGSPRKKSWKKKKNLQEKYLEEKTSCRKIEQKKKNIEKNSGKTSKKNILKVPCNIKRLEKSWKTH